MYIYVTMIFSLYFPILLSISLSVLLHAFKKHIHSFFSLFTTDNHKLHLKCQHHYATDKYSQVMDSETIAEEAAEKPSNPDPPPPIDDCVDEMRSDDDDNEDDECWRRMEAAEGRGIWRNEEAFPPLISSLNGNGQRNFDLIPERKNGRLQLCRVRVKRPEIMHATRQDGRLRLFLVPDQRDVDEEEVGEETKEELLVELEEVGESRYDDVEEEEEEEEDRKIGEWNKFHSEGGFRRCHEMLNHVHGSYHNLLLYGVTC